MCSKGLKKNEKIGEGLIRIGAMTNEQVKQVLQAQREEKGYDRLFGEIAVELEFVDQDMIESFFESKE